MPDNNLFPPPGAPFPPPAGIPYGSPGGAYRQGGTYEFTPTENEIFGGLGGSMSFVGITTIVVAVLMVLGSFGFGIAALLIPSGATAGGGPIGMGLMMVIYLVEGVLMGVVGAWFTAAAKSFRNIVTSSGNDIPNLMNAMVQLRKVFNLWRTVILVSVALLVFSCVGGILLGVLAGVRR